MDIIPKPSINSSLNSKSGKRGTAHERKIHEHRDTGVAHPSGTPIPLRVTRSYFADNYRDVITHCERLSSYDE